MPSGKSPRIQRHKKPKRRFTKHNYRQAIHSLVPEFEYRCAYSDVPVRLTGDTAMHIDHFNPRLKQRYLQDYYNLLLAQAHCNQKKGEFWPNARQLAKGIRVINPCSEPDFGEHIFECPTSHRLWGSTATGQFHIVKLGLNCRHFVDLRSERSKIEATLNSSVALSCSCDPGTLAALLQVIQRLKSMLDFFPRRFAEKPAPGGYIFH